MLKHIKLYRFFLLVISFGVVLFLSTNLGECVYAEGGCDPVADYDFTEDKNSSINLEGGEQAEDQFDEVVEPNAENELAKNGSWDADSFSYNEEADFDSDGALDDFIEDVNEDQAFEYNAESLIESNEEVSDSLVNMIQDEEEMQNFSLSLIKSIPSSVVNITESTLESVSALSESVGIDVAIDIGFEGGAIVIAPVILAVGMTVGASQGSGDAIVPGYSDFQLAKAMGDKYGEAVAVLQLVPVLGQILAGYYGAEVLVKWSISNGQDFLHDYLAALLGFTAGALGQTSTLINDLGIAESTKVHKIESDTTKKIKAASKKASKKVSDALNGLTQYTLAQRAILYGYVTPESHSRDYSLLTRYIKLIEETEFSKPGDQLYIVMSHILDGIRWSANPERPYQYSEFLEPDQLASIRANIADTLAGLVLRAGVHSRVYADTIIYSHLVAYRASVDVLLGIYREKVNTLNTILFYEAEHLFGLSNLTLTNCFNEDKLDFDPGQNSDLVGYLRSCLNKAIVFHHGHGADSRNFTTKAIKFESIVDTYIEARRNLVESLLDELDVAKDSAVAELKTDLKNDQTIKDIKDTVVGAYSDIWDNLESRYAREIFLDLAGRTIYDKPKSSDPPGDVQTHCSWKYGSGVTPSIHSKYSEDRLTVSYGDTKDNVYEVRLQDITDDLNPHEYVYSSEYSYLAAFVKPHYGNGKWRCYGNEPVAHSSKNIIKSLIGFGTLHLQSHGLSGGHKDSVTLSKDTIDRKETFPSYNLNLDPLFSDLLHNIPEDTDVANSIFESTDDYVDLYSNSGSYMPNYSLNDLISYLNASLDKKIISGLTTQDVIYHFGTLPGYEFLFLDYIDSYLSLGETSGSSDDENSDQHSLSDLYSVGALLGYGTTTSSPDALDIAYAYVLKSKVCDFKDADCGTENLISASSKTLLRQVANSPYFDVTEDGTYLLGEIQKDSDKNYTYYELPIDSGSVCQIGELEFVDINEAEGHSTRDETQSETDFKVRCVIEKDVGTDFNIKIASIDLEIPHSIFTDAANHIKANVDGYTASDIYTVTSILNAFVEFESTYYAKGGWIDTDKLRDRIDLDSLSQLKNFRGLSNFITPDYYNAFGISRSRTNISFTDIDYMFFDKEPANFTLAVFLDRLVENNQFKTNKNSLIKGILLNKFINLSVYADLVAHVRDVKTFYDDRRWIQANRDIVDTGLEITNFPQINGIEVHRQRGDETRNRNDIRRLEFKRVPARPSQFGFSVRKRFDPSIHDGLIFSASILNKCTGHDAGDLVFELNIGNQREDFIRLRVPDGTFEDLVLVTTEHRGHREYNTFHSDNVFDCNKKNMISAFVGHEINGTHLLRVDVNGYYAQYIITKELFESIDKNNISFFTEGQSDLLYRITDVSLVNTSKPKFKPATNHADCVLLDPLQQCLPSSDDQDSPGGQDGPGGPDGPFVDPGGPSGPGEL